MLDKKKLKSTALVNGNKSHIKRSTFKCLVTLSFFLGGRGVVIE